MQKNYDNRISVRGDVYGKSPSIFIQVDCSEFVNEMLFGLADAGCSIDDLADRLDTSKRFIKDYLHLTDTQWRTWKRRAKAVANRVRGGLYCRRVDNPVAGRPTSGCVCDVCVEVRENNKARHRERRLKTAGNAVAARITPREVLVLQCDKTDSSVNAMVSSWIAARRVRIDGLLGGYVWRDEGEAMAFIAQCEKASVDDVRLRTIAAMLADDANYYKTPLHALIDLLAGDK